MKANRMRERHRHAFKLWRNCKCQQKVSHMRPVLKTQGIESPPQKTDSKKICEQARYHQVDSNESQPKNAKTYEENSVVSLQDGQFQECATRTQTSTLHADKRHSVNNGMQLQLRSTHTFKALICIVTWHYHVSEMTLFQTRGQAKIKTNDDENIHREPEFQPNLNTYMWYKRSPYSSV